MKDIIKYIDFEIFNFDNEKSLYLFNRKTNDIIKMG